MSCGIKFADVKRALAPTLWDKGNGVLYDLCKKYPEHKEDSDIIAKIWLIGRSYSAAVERRKNAKTKSDGFYENEVAPLIRKSDLDKWLADLPGKINDSGSRLGHIVEAHWQLTDLFRRITGLKKRSLASKYLHFHKPDLFFLYDSRASEAVKKVTPKLRSIKTINAKKSDEEYLVFCRRAQWLMDEIKTKFGHQLSMRQLDILLLNLGM